MSTAGHASEKSVLLVGTFITSMPGKHSVCEDLAARLAGSGWSVLTTSKYLNRFHRLADMMATTWRERHRYAVAQVDVYSGLAFVWAEAVCWTLRRAGKPYVLTLHGGNLPAFAQRHPARVRRLLQSALRVTTPSRFLLEQMLPYRQDLFLLPNAVSLQASDFRLRGQPAPRLVWLRAFHAIYNPALMPQVVKRLQADFPSIQATMVGPDKGDGSFQATVETARALGVEDRFEFPGGVAKDDVPRWLNQSDIFVNTTNFDNTPVSVLEAMACGLPVVSTNVGGIPYLLEDEHDALLVPPDDAEAMANAVRRILTEPGLAARLSANARAKIDQFDWAVILPQWESLLTQSMSRSTP